uniref:DNA-directed RNA polymerase n=1 Tax=Gossypium raimondii TaxID=29730 RepID=A0A0D2NNJ1_GOSRA|nr:hypothetical protein B456_002G152500 [Gossypium raimondii]
MISNNPIPFIEHNDANRALMSSNMQRQAVSLSRSEKCIVGTGLERQVALDSGVPAIADHEGKIISTDTDKIILSVNGDALGIPLVMYQRSNKNTCMHQTARVRRGKCIKKGQILADGAATVGGELALGKNVLVAYMPWEGYNFEDAVLISERLVYEISILPCFSSSILFHGAKVQNMEETGVSTTLPPSPFHLIPIS